MLWRARLSEVGIRERVGGDLGLRPARSIFAASDDARLLGTPVSRRVKKGPAGTASPFFCMKRSLLNVQLSLLGGDGELRSRRQLQREL